MDGTFIVYRAGCMCVIIKLSSNFYFYAFMVSLFAFAVAFVVRSLCNCGGQMRRRGSTYVAYA